MTTTPHQWDRPRLESAWRLARRVLLDERNAAGHWPGELSSSALSTATALSALGLLRQSPHATSLCPQDELERLIQGGLRWLDEHQNPDGGFGDTDLSYSNISTSMLVLAAWRLLGVEASRSDACRRAEAYVDRCGGVAGVRARYGKDKTFAVPILANAAIAGRVEWREVAALPFEAACVPQSWYRFLQLPVVSYAIPALVAIGQARHFHRPSWNPLVRWLRAWAVRPSRRVLSRMQPESGGYLEAIPLTSFVTMGLLSCGAADDPVVAQGVKFIRESVRSDGSWPIDTNLATWNTDLATLALARGSASTDATEAEGWATRELIEWILSCQYRERHPFTGAAPGGWGWSDLSGAVPDADDTPAAMLALKTLTRLPSFPHELTERVESAVRAGATWLGDLQNRDGGWPTFCRGWGKLPFDRSGSDLTAHALRALWAWRDVLGVQRSDRPIVRAFRYLYAQQRPDGSWLPLWFGNQDNPDDENPIYGTVKVLCAFRDLEMASDAAAKRGQEWLWSQQREDGSWGGGA
ncbi:MAG: prenyltransferase/squalene oxidase repeat-containing protein [Pirellulaceae bacterium]